MVSNLYTEGTFSVCSLQMMSNLYIEETFLVCWLKMVSSVYREGIFWSIGYRWCQMFIHRGNIFGLYVVALYTLRERFRPVRMSNM